jgi:hypothetical protein
LARDAAFGEARMKLKPALRLITILCLSMTGASTAQADACLDRFKSILINGNGDEPVKIHAIQAIKGAPETTNNFYMRGPDHWMTEMLDPAGQPWVLAYNNVMYTSADQGKSWTKLREMDSAQNKDAALEARKENAETAKNAACGQEELDGVTYDTVEADYRVVQALKTDNHNKYWLDTESGYIAKAIYHVKADNFESTITQTMEPAPDLTLPMPK